MRKYETIFVVDSLLKSDEIDSIISKYERFISANGGKIEDIEHWGKKRLAYEIKKRQYGYYVLIRFDGPPTMIRTLEREYRLNESLLRYKTLTIPKAALQTMQESEQKPESAEKQAPQPKAQETKAAKEETTSEEVKAEEKPAVEAEEKTETEESSAPSQEEETTKKEE